MDSRLTRLAHGVDGSSRRRPVARDVQRIMGVVGMVVMALGIGTVVLGWYGASHSPYLYQEIPYLISGGLLGVALVVAGGVLYLASWSLRQVREGRRNAELVARALERLGRDAPEVER